MSRLIKPSTPSEIDPVNIWEAGEASSARVVVLAKSALQKQILEERNALGHEMTLKELEAHEEMYLLDEMFNDFEAMREQLHCSGEEEEECENWASNTAGIKNQPKSEVVSKWRAFKSLITGGAKRATKGLSGGASSKGPR